MADHELTRLVAIEHIAQLRRDLEAERALCERFRLAIIAYEDERFARGSSECPACKAVGYKHAVYCVVLTARDASARGVP